MLPFFHLLPVRHNIILEIIFQMRRKTFFEAFPTPSRTNFCLVHILEAINTLEKVLKIIIYFSLAKTPATNSHWDYMPVQARRKQEIC
jgi:hypothetical protein